MLFASNLVSALAAGMSVKFFPVFFLTAVGLGPLVVNLIFAGTPVLMALAMYASKARRFVFIFENLFV